MIKVGYDRDRLAATFSGHAGYSEKGKDIVCAGVSTLFFTMLAYGALLEKQDDEKLLYFEYKNAENRAVFDAMICGIELLAKEFPLYLKIETRKTFFEGDPTVIKNLVLQ